MKEAANVLSDGGRVINIASGVTRSAVPGNAAGPPRRLFHRADITTGFAWLTAASTRALQRVLPGTARTPDSSCRQVPQWSGRLRSSVPRASGSVFEYLPSRPDGYSAARCDEGQPDDFGGEPRTQMWKQSRHHDETG